MKSIKEKKHVWHLAQPTNRPLPSFPKNEARNFDMNTDFDVAPLLVTWSDLGLKFWGYMEVS